MKEWKVLVGIIAVPSRHNSKLPQDTIQRFPEGTIQRFPQGIRFPKAHYRKCSLQKLWWLLEGMKWFPQGTIQRFTLRHHNDVLKAHYRVHNSCFKLFEAWKIPWRQHNGSLKAHLYIKDPWVNYITLNRNVQVSNTQWTFKM